MPALGGIRVLALSDPAQWKALSNELDGRGDNFAATEVLDQLERAGVKSALIEDTYLDRDFSAEYSQFYSTLFQRYRRQASRIHFFKNRLDDLSQGKSLTALAEIIKSSEADYVGFIVARPVEDCAIGRTVLSLLPRVKGATLHVSSSYTVHILGTRLSVTGVPFMQQDTRVTACAQVAIWICGRHFHSAHDGPWFTTPDIAEAASTPTDITLTSSLPAGAGGLGINSMLRALRTMGRHPYTYSAEDENNLPPRWNSELNPREILSRYVGSGMPVILGISPWEPESEDKGPRDWHAVVAVGAVYNGAEFSDNQQKHISDLISSFVVHDDQRGCYLRMSCDDTPLDTPYSLKNVGYILIPLPGKVFIPGETAETTSWDILRQYVEDWEEFKNDYKSTLDEISENLGDAFHRLYADGEIVARTYLTHGWRYKERILACTVAEKVKEHVLNSELPRMVWVTEFYAKSDFIGCEDAMPGMFAHCVVDATSTGAEPPLLFHGPGRVVVWEQRAPLFYPEFEDLSFSVRADGTYSGRER